MEQSFLYVVLSSTPYKMGNFVRFFTGDLYNHASISFDECLQQLYGFSRRYYRTPFYGGFVSESASRYHLNGQAAQIKLFRIPVAKEPYNALYGSIQAMLDKREHYIYNHLSALCAVFHRQLPAKDAYICIEFVVQCLNAVGLDFDTDKYYSIGDLERQLDPYLCYTGPMPEAWEYDTGYYAKKPIPRPFLTTATAFFEIFRRLGK